MNIFSSIPVPKRRSNRFNLSHEVKLTCELGQLVPIMCQPVLPGDKWQIQNEVFIRLAPMLAPIMHQVNVYVHHFFVPNRIIWKPFEEFITGGLDGLQAPALPYMYAYDFYSNSVTQTFLKMNSLADYLGLPTLDGGGINGDVNIQMLPFMAYQKIYQDYYMDENLETPDLEFPLSHEGKIENTGGITGNQGWWIKLASLRTRAWRKDYFTGALPWPQRGADVTLPMHGDAELEISGSGQVSTNSENEFWSHVKTNTGQPYDGSVTAREGVLTGQAAEVIGVYGPSGGTIQASDIASKLSGNVDLSQVTAATINELRTAVKTQEFLEASARGGNRYIENIMAHFGVKSSDARLQRAEFLGGGIIPVQIGNVYQTSQSTEESPLAEFSGNGMAAGMAGSRKKYFEEHGYIMSILSIIPKASYQQGIPRDYLKLDKFDWYWPEFAHLGEQAIHKCELYARSDDMMGTFGYVPRYSEYKFIPSSVHGEFKDSLSYWHLGRIFESEPVLNSQFIKVNYDKNGLDRIWAVTDDTNARFYVQCLNKVSTVRKMPRYGVPRF